MTVSQKMFLLAAGEMNFSRAAEKAFVTPQCLSDHIKRLEEQYQVTLFRRRPHLQLTEEGKTLLRYLDRIQALEDHLTNELADIRGGIRGTIRFGIPTTRGGIVVGKAAVRFQERFPHVDLQVHYGDTGALEELLLTGKLDLLLGVNASQHVLFQRRALCHEPLYLVISQNTMEKQFGSNCANILTAFAENSADLALLQEVPFVQGDERSTTTTAFRCFLLKSGLQVRLPVQSSHFDVLIDLCRLGNYATVCSRFYIRRLMDLESREDPANPIWVFPIRGCTETLGIELITHRDTPPLEYLSLFSQIIEETVLLEDRAVRAWLDAKGN